MLVSDGTGRDRKLFSRAVDLMQQAGFERKNGQFHDKERDEILAGNSQQLRCLWTHLQSLCTEAAGNWH